MSQTPPRVDQLLDQLPERQQEELGVQGGPRAGVDENAARVVQEAPEGAHENAQDAPAAGAAPADNRGPLTLCYISLTGQE